MISFLTSLFSGISALSEIISLLYAAYKSAKKISSENQQKKAAEGIQSGDTIKAEEGLGNPDAGKPSGIGQIRDKKTP